MKRECEASRDGRHRLRVAGNPVLGITYYECRVCGHKRDMESVQQDQTWTDCGHHDVNSAGECNDCGCRWTEGVWLRPPEGVEVYIPKGIDHIPTKR